MPKILINEKDRTSPGTPGSYANYSVLIAGYKNREPVLAPIYESDNKTVKVPADKVLPDSNGVYEFSSRQDFEDVIGLADVEKTVTVLVDDEEVKRVERHYGNRMAAELLNLGYDVIYWPIESIDDISNEANWEIFKDKASYDFRFVSHGMLDTTYEKDAFDELNGRLAEIEADMKKLADIIADVEASEAYKTLEKNLAAATEESAKVTIRESIAALYASVYEDVIDAGYNGFKVSNAANADTYGYIEAVNNLTENAEGEIPAYKKQKDDVDAYDKVTFTPNVFNKINGIIAKLACYRTDDAGVVLCGGRGDCTALIELDKNCYVVTNSTDRPEALIIDGINNMSTVTKTEGPYCAMTVPSVHYKMSGDVVEFPGAFHYLACFMNALGGGFAEWYAAAGYTRGVASYVIDHTDVKLGEIAINALEPRNIVDASAQPKFACNVIANFRGSYYLWGNRTAAELGAAAGGNDLTADDFLNIRQLCTTIKKQLYVACRRFTFDPNSDTLWFNFVNAITPTLDRMKADQGVRDYKIIKVFTDKKATLKAKIRIIPIEAVEDFDLEISLEDSFGETSAVVNG